MLNVMDWKSGGTSLRCGTNTYEVFSSPYSLGCNVERELVAVNIFLIFQSIISLRVVG